MATASPLASRSCFFSALNSDGRWTKSAGGSGAIMATRFCRLGPEHPSTATGLHNLAHLLPCGGAAALRARAGDLREGARPRASRYRPIRHQSGRWDISSDRGYISRGSCPSTRGPLLEFHRIQVIRRNQEASGQTPRFALGSGIPAGGEQQASLGVGARPVAYADERGAAAVEFHPVEGHGDVLESQRAPPGRQPASGLGAFGFTAQRLIAIEFLRARERSNRAGTQDLPRIAIRLAISSELISTPNRRATTRGTPQRRCQQVPTARGSPTRGKGLRRACV
jgi:hypothetical protein